MNQEHLVERAETVVYTSFVTDMKARNYIISMDIRALRDKNSGNNVELAFDLFYDFHLIKKDKDGEYTERIYTNKFEKLHMKCEAQGGEENIYCDKHSILDYNKVKGGDYMIMFEFHKIQEYEHLIYSFEFVGKTMNMKYTEFNISIRYIFIALSGVVFAFYLYNLKGYWVHRNFEQHYISI